MNTSATAGQTPDQLSINDRVSHLASAQGRYLIKKPGQGSRSRAFACRLKRISPISLTFSGPMPAQVGETVTTYFTEFGMLPGHVRRNLGYSLVVDLDLSAEERKRLAAKVIWAEKHRNFQVPDNRQSKRVLPRSPNSHLVIPGRGRVRCFVIDMSATGAAVSAEVDPEIGSVLALGSVVGRVVRKFATGFAIMFEQRFELEVLEPKIIVPLQVDQFVSLD
ncbi:hypothetical protein GCM10007989_36600 [Devosia pacifica]|uniref:PilZ domain-containing protein n=1 Tax=Devosia pacifica TaxID=1335967 RepID=A0A918SEK5_9HYPH|nr:PilZ domain-containing protein [Devosia pacifica]GHA37121.1 hypothetical protein GCM10007989_36600 [Devosia pacifica]